MKRLPYLAILCYAALIAAWVLDLVTPQLFVAAILLNAPIALSGLALNSRLTSAMIVLAEVANLIAGYVNGVQAAYHWDAIAVGDRLLSAASFLLVGYLTVRAQEFSREAGSASERARLAAGEKALRRALEAVRATLNVALVLRAIVREAQELLDADKAVLIVQSSSLAVPDLYRFDRGDAEVRVERRALDAPTSAIVQRTSEDQRFVVAGPDDPIARMVLSDSGAARMAALRIPAPDAPAVLLLFSTAFGDGTERLLQLFGEGASVALNQAWLFTQLGLRNEEIASQRNVLEDRGRVIRDIVYALAHDLRTPLTAEHVTMQQALDGAYGSLPEAYRHVLRTTLQANEELRQLVETLLVVARFESGESSSLRETFDLNQQVNRVCQELAPIAAVKNVQVIIGSGGSAPVCGDASEVRRAVANLLSNAITASPPGGEVNVTVAARDGSARIEVRDEGHGVLPEQRPRLFERFSAGARPAGAGTGLGLYIVRLIAEKLGGSVWYEPRDPSGSIFGFSLPLVSEPVVHA